MSSSDSWEPLFKCLLRGRALSLAGAPGAALKAHSPLAYVSVDAFYRAEGSLSAE